MFSSNPGITGTRAFKKKIILHLRLSRKLLELVAQYPVVSLIGQ